MLFRSRVSITLFYYFVIFAAGSMGLTQPGWANTSSADSSKHLDAVREFADNVLKYGRDTYGPKHTPLFVDGLNVNSREPVKWISPKGNVLTATETEEWILSNFASQQTLLRTLDGLSVITGDPKYRDAAKEATAYALENLTSPNGLLYWGHAAAYDAQADKIYSLHNTHTLKIHYPYYQLMWSIDPDKTKQFIESFWSAHVLDWSNLDFCRISVPYSESLPKPWDHAYSEKPTFFMCKRSWGNGFFHTGTSLAYGGAMLHRLSGYEPPFVWSRRLIRRLAETRHPATSISAHTYNKPQRMFPNNDMAEHFHDPYTTVFPFHPFEGKRKLQLMYFNENWQPLPWISLLLIGDMLGEEGKDFTQWAVEELIAWGKASYREADNAFVPILTDGKSIEGVVLEATCDLGVKGDIAKPLFAGPEYFWAYATAYRVSGDELIWQMARHVGRGNGFGDIGTRPGVGPKLETAITSSDSYGLLGFLELYRKQDDPEFLNAARRIGGNIVANKFHKGFFVLSKQHIFSRFGCIEPLALLHLSDAVSGCQSSIPEVWPECPIFIPPYRYKETGNDRWMIYRLTESSEVPWSLQEASYGGDIEKVKSLIKSGVSVNSLGDSGKSTALYRAVQGEHEGIVALLLAEGADVDFGDVWFGETPLHYACKNGQKEMVEFLVDKGADSNVKNNKGQTALHIAVSNNHKDIAELLIDQGADVNAKDNDGQTPQGISEMQSRNLILLIFFAAMPLALSVIIAIPLVLYLRRVVGQTKCFFRYFVLLIGICLVEYFALIAGLSFFSEEASTIVFVLVLACVWGVIFGLWLRGRSTARNVLKVSVFISLYASLTIISLSVLIILLQGKDMANPEAVAGSPFEGLPWPLNTILGFFTIVTLGIVIAKTAITTGEVALLIRLKDRSASGKTAGIIMFLAIILAIVLCVFFFYKKNQKLHIAAQSGMQVHDVAVTNVSAPKSCDQGDTVSIVVTLDNRGDYGESCVVKLMDAINNREISGRSVQLSSKHHSAAEADLILTGENVSDWFGDRHWLEGDLNGDGVNDILISAANWNNGTGRVYLYYGGANISSTPDLVFQGEGTEDNFGDWGNPVRPVIC